MSRQSDSSSVGMLGNLNGSRSNRVATIVSSRAEFNPFRTIHVQDAYCCSSDCGEADNQGSFNSEVFNPRIISRMKQAADFSGLRISAGEIAGFVEVAVVTGEAKIGRFVKTAVFSRKWSCLLRKRTVLAPVFRTQSNLGAERRSIIFVPARPVSGAL